MQGEGAEGGAVTLPVSKRSSIPVLNYVVVHAQGEQLHVSGTDLDTSATMSVEADVEAEGKVLIGRSFVQRLIMGAKDFELDEDKEGLVLTVDGSTVTVPVLPFEDFPALPQPKSAGTVTLPGPKLAKAFDKIKHAITNEGTRYYLSGALLKVKGKTLEFVATDGHRLAHYKANGLGTGTIEILVSAAAILSAKQFLGEADVVIGEEERFGFMRTKGAELIWKKVDGEFPEYENILKKKPDTALIVDRQALQTVVKRIVTTLKGKALKLETLKAVTGYELVLSASEAGTGARLQHTVGAKWDGKEMQVGLNPKYVLEALAAIEADEVTIPVRDHESAVFFQGDEELTEVVMPVRL